MVRFLVVLVLLGVVGVLVVGRTAAQPFEVHREGRSVRIVTEHVEARYSLAGSVSESYMLFGADSQPADWESAYFLGVTSGDAVWLVNEYPDLKRCGTAGAEHFKRIAEQIYVIGGNGRAHRTLQQAAALHEEREEEGGERFCVSMRGQRMVIDSVGIPAAGRDLTDEMQRARRDAHDYLVDSAEISDCS